MELQWILIVILLMVLLLPFLVRKVEENLELFLFTMGLAAVLVSNTLDLHLAQEALREPIAITLAVLVAGVLFYLGQHSFNQWIVVVLQRISLPLLVFLVIVVLGLLSSVITAIIAAVLLVELISRLPIPRSARTIITILACYSIGFGAILTPIGEPLSTITIAKLNADFFYLWRLLSSYVIPTVLIMGVLGAFYVYRLGSTQLQDELNEPAFNEEHVEDIMEEESLRSVIIRSLKVYLFVMALVLLGSGFQPLIDQYILNLDNRLLYWINMISAVLDNATLAAAEISPRMEIEQIKAVLMGLIISGGMLIPGNIPNIISASKLRITMKEWAYIGVPFGLVMMAGFFLILFI